MQRIEEKEDPYRILAVQGTHDLLEHAGRKAVAVIPQLIMPLKKALNTRDPEVCPLSPSPSDKFPVSSGQAGEALVPYYRQLLPCCNLFISKRKNLGSEADFGQRRRRDTCMHAIHACMDVCMHACTEDVGVLIEETLKILEETGGPDAFVNIKYLVPIYESQVLVAAAAAKAAAAAAKAAAAAAAAGTVPPATAAATTATAATADAAPAAVATAAAAAAAAVAVTATATATAAAHTQVFFSSCTPGGEEKGEKRNSSDEA
ncbi:hypothetical protein Efla_006046 [Eimeria flavescens]